MRVELDQVHVMGRRDRLLEIDHLALSTGECVLVAGEPGQGHSALALATTGRLAPTGGSVRLVADDGTVSDDMAQLRRVTAVVDLPGVSEPDDVMPVETVAAEDLALAGHDSTPGAVHTWLEQHALEGFEDHRVDAVEGVVRTALLTGLAAERPDVRFLVMTLPDRHGGEAYGWWHLATSYAALGYGVLVQCTRSSARDLGADLPPARGGHAHRITPVEALRLMPSAGTAGELGDTRTVVSDDPTETRVLEGTPPPDPGEPPPPPQERNEGR
ncbi:hypothetical protein [Nocardioides sp. zg-1228]|uniref:hypothetical protein n=1 Tax=Nocardioides sp. zg-1228 TaxID=2763008 RepID=UPI0016434CD6|nr:hypothetical protein [Nocardioides sp. zg-1228]MBC2933082.1 hypothetical protein [Nocardioides sp. zg-1228]QSF56728.1 hypothetical protein JX575_14095 [Nocardioides sp. zg-1228]